MFNLAWKFKSRLKFSILTSRISHKNWGLVGGSLEIFNLAWKFQDLDFFQDLGPVGLGRPDFARFLLKMLYFPEFFTKIGAPQKWPFLPPPIPYPTFRPLNRFQSLAASVTKACDANARKFSAKFLLILRKWLPKSHYPNLIFLAFLDFLAFSISLLFSFARNSLRFWVFFPLSQGFGGFGKRKKSLFFWRFSLPFFKKARKRRSGYHTVTVTYLAIWNPTR